MPSLARWRLVSRLADRHLVWARRMYSLRSDVNKLLALVSGCLLTNGSAGCFQRQAGSMPGTAAMVPYPPPSPPVMCSPFLCQANALAADSAHRPSASSNGRRMYKGPRPGLATRTSMRRLELRCDGYTACDLPPHGTRGINSKSPGGDATSACLWLPDQGPAMGLADGRYSVRRCTNRRQKGRSASNYSIAWD